MSLVSTVNKQEHGILVPNGDASAVQTVTASATTQAGKPVTTRVVRGYSVYHTGEGAQLSKGALYRAKVKYGIYQSPALAHSTGVANTRVASDVAAHRANENKTTIEAYKRLFVDPDAHKAAARSVINGGPRVEAVVIPSSHHGSHQAATRAYSTASMASEENARRAREPVLPAASRANSLKSANRAFYHTRTPVVEQIVPKHVGNKPMDMSKVLSSAERKAENRINDRFVSVKRYNLGIPSGGYSKAASSSLRKPVYKVGEKEKENHAPVAKVDQSLYAKSAAYAVKDMDPAALTNKEFEERARVREQLLSQLTSQKVLAKARENAEREMAATPYDIHTHLFGNEAYNKAAIEVAQRNAQSRVDTNEGKINLGGGLWLSPDDVHTIARNLVDPVLGEVHQRADDQRATDLDISDRNDYVTSEWAAWISMHQTKEHNNEALLTNSKNKREKEEASAKGDATKKYTDLCSKMDKQVNEKTALLDQTKEAREQLEKDMEEKLALDVQTNKESLADLKRTHKGELKAAREEQKMLLQPYHDRLNEASLEHERLVQERVLINEKIAQLHESIEVHRTNISKYERALESGDEQHKTAQEELEGLQTDRDDVRGHFDDHVVTSANMAKEQAALSTEEARLKNLEIEALVNERKSVLNSTEHELQREKLNMLEAMRDTAEARGDENIDEERVKQLIGMTSSDYIAEQKRLQKKARKAARKAAKEEARRQKAEAAAASAAEPEAEPVGEPVTEPVTEPVAKLTTEAETTREIEADGVDGAENKKSKSKSKPKSKAKAKTEDKPEAALETTKEVQIKENGEGEKPVAQEVVGKQPHRDDGDAVSQTSDVAEPGDEELQELTASDADQATRGEPQNSYFKEVF